MQWRAVGRIGHHVWMRRFGTECSTVCDSAAFRWLTCFAGEEIVSWGAPLYVDIRMTETFLTAPPAKEDVLGQSRSDPGSTSEISMLQDGLFAG